MLSRRLHVLPGFILTIFALFLALTGNGLNTITSDAILNQFGLAILATFVGMSGRIVFIQFLTTSVGDDDTLRQTMAEYVRELQKETDVTLSGSTLESLKNLPE